MRLAIVGLDSAWLAHGGADDYGKLIVGERQVINALRVVQGISDPPHVVIAMVHHPFHMLQEFDRPRVMRRMEEVCQFVHCGHLHEPEVRATVSGRTECLTITAGASYETRESRNSYSIVTLDLLRAVRKVVTHQYDPTNSTFLLRFTHMFRIEIPLLETCSIAELAEAIQSFDPRLVQWAYYLSALLLEQKTDIPVTTDNGYTVASFDILQVQPDDDLKRATVGFFAFKNVLRVLHGRQTLDRIFVDHGSVVSEYGAMLRTACDRDQELRHRLDALESDGRRLMTTIPTTFSWHTNALLSELVEQQKWQLLCEHAERHTNSPDPETALFARRMLALGLARSEETADKKAAITLYRSLADDDTVGASDLGNLAILLSATGDFDEAKSFLLRGIEKFPTKTYYFVTLGQRIVAETGDREFRMQMEMATRDRGNDGE